MRNTNRTWTTPDAARPSSTLTLGSTVFDPEAQTRRELAEVRPEGSSPKSARRLPNAQLPNAQRMCRSMGICAASVIGCSVVIAALSWHPSVLKGADDKEAAEKAAPTAFVMLSGSDDLMGDAKYLLDLTNPVEQKQWPILKSYFEIFLIGVDPKLPTRIGVIFGDQANRYVLSVPVTKILEIPQGQRRETHHSAYQGDRAELVQAWKREEGRLQRLHAVYAAPYAHIGETKDDVTGVAADPRPELQPLTSRKFMAAIDLRNKQTDAASQAKRRELFQATRKQTLAALKKEKGETPADFDLRKKALEIELDEGEWFFAEMPTAQLGLTLDRTSGNGRFDLETDADRGDAPGPIDRAIANQAEPFRQRREECRADPLRPVQPSL